MKVSVLVFPGTNCDHDTEYLYGKLLGAEVQTIWHRSKDLQNPDMVVLPGGFAYGDYLRTGAMAKLSPIMAEVKKFANSGGPVLGICNGFQILCEVGLLPGVLLQNKQMRFLSQFLNIKVENVETPFTKHLKKDSCITCPVAHFDGNYFLDGQDLKSLQKNDQIVFRYCDANGNVDPNNTKTNPNGSVLAIAGVCNKERNVVGLMPHPERAAEAVVGHFAGASGMQLFA